MRPKQPRVGLCPDCRAERCSVSPLEGARSTQHDGRQSRKGGGGMRDGERPGETHTHRIHRTLGTRGPRRPKEGLSVGDILLRSTRCDACLLPSCMTLCNPGTAARPAPLSTGFSRQESWSGWPFPLPGDLLNPGIKYIYIYMLKMEAPKRKCDTTQQEKVKENCLSSRI